MEHLKSGGIIVFLSISYNEMVKRLNNIKTRGIVLFPGQTLRDVYDQRIPLYEKYADIRIDCSNDPFEHIVEKVVDSIQEKSS
jgi:shikimate kinase